MHDMLRRLQLGPPPRILVVGDVMLDRYTWGDADRVSPEAPILVLRADRSEVRLGGAASVALLLRGLGARVELVGVTGDDSEGRTLRRLLEESSLGQTAVIADPGRPTTCKERLIGRADQRHSHPILRVDRESRETLSAELEAQLIGCCLQSLPRNEVVLISDYGKGVCTPSLLETIIAAAKRAGKPILIDPARGRDYDIYRGATLLKPNRFEAEQSSRIRISNPSAALEAARVLRGRYGLSAVVVTLDCEGMVVVADDGSEHFPIRTRKVYDITGAGDMVLAALGYAFAKGELLFDGVRFANTAAGLEVERWGIEPIPWPEIERECQDRLPCHNKVLSRDELLARVRQHRGEGQRIIFTNGCFDLLHIGHVTYLEEAARLGDVLIVAVNSDRSVKKLKGNARPLIKQDDRAALLGSLAAVDYVTVFDEDTPHGLLAQLQPEVLVKGGTYSVDEVAGRELVTAYGGQVIVVRAVDAVSTSRILQLCRGAS